MPSIVGREPVVTVATIVALVVALGAIFNVVIDANTLTSIAASAAPIVAAVIARFHVTPVKK